MYRAFYVNIPGLSRNGTLDRRHTTIITSKKIYKTLTSTEYGMKT